MKITAKDKKILNKIASKYCKGYIEMTEIQKFYNEIDSLGVTTGMLSFGQRSCEYYVDGKEVENSQFVFSIYRPEHSSKVEFTIYFS